MKSMQSISIVALAALFMWGCQRPLEDAAFTNADPTRPLSVELSDVDIENIVRRSYQYVAMYNVNNKFASQRGRLEHLSS